MKRGTNKIGASIRARLLNGARDRREDFNLVLQRYAAERFLYRLGASRHRELFVLKGAMLFVLWGGSMYRATRDLDLTGLVESDPETLTSAIREICAVSSPGDGIEFLADTVQADPIRDDSEYGGFRVRVGARLDTARITLQIDVGFGNAIVPGAEETDYPAMLDGPQPRIRAYTPESVIAEKLHAIVALGAANSRMKDYYDLFVIGERFHFDGERLARSITATFQRRNTSIPITLPVGLTPAYFSEESRAERWGRYLDRNGLTGAPKGFDAVGESLRGFLGQLLRIIAGGVGTAGFWNPGGPWRAETASQRFVSRVPLESAENRPAPLPSISSGPQIQTKDISNSVVTGLGRFRPYTIHKDSGVEWLGEIPGHLEGEEVKRLCLVRRGASPRPIDDPIYFDDDGEYAWVRISDVTASDRYLEHTTQKLSALGKSKSVPLELGELFLSIAATVGKPVITKIKCCIHDGFVYFVGLSENREYLYYLFSCGEPYKGLGKLGTQLNLNTDTIGDIYLPRPSGAEQETIVQYLDRETAKIDALIAKKERLIELLQEKRTALISNAVTKGLDPNVPMKDSGVEWLGEIPAHWRVVPLYARYEVALGKMLDAKRISGRHLRPYVRNVDVQWDRVNIDDLPEMDFSPDEYDRFALRLGDLLVCEGGEVGRTAMWRCELPECYYQKAVHRLRPLSAKDVPRFLFWIMFANAAAGRFVAGGNPNTIYHLTAIQLRRYRFPFPSEEEQSATASYLGRETAKIDVLAVKVHEGVERLKEYRTALISAAVTGKIDVREEVAS